MPAKEAKARIKINNLLQESGWRILDNHAGKANVVLENNVKITHTVSDDLGEDFEKTSNGYAEMGITGIVDNSLIPANTNQALSIIRSKDNFVPQFIMHYLMPENIQNQIESIKVGVAQFNLSLKQVSQILIPKVEKEIQKQIVSKIEEERRLVNANKKLIELFEQKIKDRIAKVWGE